jgi:hypothetical protein
LNPSLRFSDALRRRRMQFDTRSLTDSADVLKSQGMTINSDDGILL